MEECKIGLQEMQRHNDGGAIRINRTGKAEETKLSLRHIRNIHKIKSDGLGYCYSVLGDNAWQILSEIQLYNLENHNINISMIERSLGLSHAITHRYLQVLQAERFLEKSAGSEQSDFDDLQLSDFGQTKVQNILEKCTAIFTSIFIYSEPSAVVTD